MAETLRISCRVAALPSGTPARWGEADRETGGWFQGGTSLKFRGCKKDQKGSVSPGLKNPSYGSQQEIREIMRCCTECGYFPGWTVLEFQIRNNRKSAMILKNIFFNRSSVLLYCDCIHKDSIDRLKHQTWLLHVLPPSSCNNFESMVERHFTTSSSSWMTNLTQTPFGLLGDLCALKVKRQCLSPQTWKPLVTFVCFCLVFVQSPTVHLHLDQEGN